MEFRHISLYNHPMQDFQELYKQLILASPHLSTHIYMCTNSDYSDQLNESKNAYICFNGYGLEDCMYNFDSRWNKDCTDLSYTNKCTLCYNCIDTEDSYNCDYLQDCENCRDCAYCFDCFGCSDCFGCVGLRKANHHIFNKPIPKENYKAELKKAHELTEQRIYCELDNLRVENPHVAMHVRRSENCLGNYIYDSKNAYYAFKSHELEDCIYMYDSRGMKDSTDTSMLHKSTLMYECVEATENYNCNFIYWCANCNDCEYIMYCFNCDDCFGCFNLKHKRFHILNKPYKEKVYFAKVEEIKKALKAENNYGNFLPDIIQ